MYIADQITLQKCSTCGIEKPLTEYHKRGKSFRKSCKVCTCQRARINYSENGKQKARTTKKAPVNAENFAALEIRISKLRPKLMAIAADFAIDIADAEDVYQSIVESILINCKPTDTDSYLLKMAKYRSQELMDKRRLYNFRVDGFTSEEDCPALNDAATMSAEDELIQRELSAELQEFIKSLPPKNQEVISMLIIGLSQREISERMRTSEANISKHIIKFRTRLFNAGITSPGKMTASAQA